MLFGNLVVLIVFSQSLSHSTVDLETKESSCPGKTANNSVRFTILLILFTILINMVRAKFYVWHRSSKLAEHIFVQCSAYLPLHTVARVCWLVTFV